MFPEIRRRLKEFAADRGEVLSLNLKSAAGVSFSTTELDFLRKYPTIMAALGAGMPTWSGQSVTRDTALNHSVVWASYRLVTGTIGRLPANLMQAVTGGKRDATEHPMFRAMHDEPNPEVSARSWKETKTGHCLLEGDGFSKIHRRSGTGVAIELEKLLPGQVAVDREKQGRKRLVYTILNEFGGKDGDYIVERGKPHDIFHLRGLSWDGTRGHNVLQVGRQSIGSAIAAERHVGSFWSNGGRKPFWLERPFKFADDDEFKKWRDEFKQVYSDPSNAYVSEDGTKLHEIGTTLAESQALESRQWTVSELSRWWGVSPHLVGDLSKATFSNIEQLFLEFKTITIADWVNRWEQDFNRCVLTPEEKEKNYFLRFNLNAFLIGDFKTRMEGYASALQNGHMCIDDVLELEDRNTLANGAGQARHIQLNMQTIPGTGEPTAAERAMLSKDTPSDIKAQLLGERHHENQIPPSL